MEPTSGTEHVGSYRLASTDATFSQRLSSGSGGTSFLSLDELLAHHTLRARITGNEGERPTLGRYELCRCIGRGGMGSVYLADDPRLKRPVAIKELRRRSGQSAGTLRQQIEREARILARLSHPNIVHVYEIIELDRLVYVVMEYIDGETLDHWLRRAQPSTGQLLACWMAAGQALAAAHELGLVHRDFKPGNVMRSKDGRIRVIDFGVAVSYEDQDAVHELAGTPAYMAPEQHSGAKVDPATDQYAFCLCVYEALTGQRGLDKDGARRESAQSGATHRLRNRRFFSALRRGMRTDPSARFPSMSNLLAELATAQSVARRRRTIALAGVGMIALQGLIVAFNHEFTERQCQAAGRVVYEYWHEEAREALAKLAHAQHGAAYAEEVSTSVAARIDKFARAWAAASRENCGGHRRGDLSDQLYEARNACLKASLSTLASGLRRLVGAQPEKGAPLDMPNFAARLDQPGRCSVMTEVPAMAAVKTGVDEQALAEIEAGLLDVEVAAWLGQIDSARASSAELVDAARANGHAPQLARALAVAGRVEMQADQGSSRDQAKRLFGEAQELALIHDMPAIAVEAAARRFYLLRGDNGMKVVIDAEARLIKALSRNPATGSFPRALLHNNLGVVARASGDDDTALEEFKTAEEVVEAMVAPDLELNAVDVNLAMAATSAKARVAGFERAVTRYRQTLGPQHPTTLRYRSLLARHRLDAAGLVRDLSRLSRDYAQFHPNLYLYRSRTEFALASIHMALGNGPKAIAGFDSAALLFRQHSGQSRQLGLDALLADAFAALVRGKSSRAVSLFVQASEQAQDLPWWRAYQSAYAWGGLGASLRAQGQPTKAREAVLQAISEFSQVVQRDKFAHHRVHYAMVLANFVAMEGSAAVLPGGPASDTVWAWFYGAGFRDASNP